LDHAPRCLTTDARANRLGISGHFASRKLFFRQVLAIIALLVNGAKGKAELEFCREIGDKIER
jgi:hypothetical protein